MVVKSERTGERPETVEIAGTDVWAAPAASPRASARSREARAVSSR